ncbi:hypothetical protein K431DRAFT_121622 [Polychaeton citri CBS 116435]|uniref:Uncharacterized protein n=1 Tax=Polychaeton citri CBS 116435 TaxID=1314669 RepID=A0A9P4UMV4_9PEZI|nr:hypothetical protein K431DRAFT_121622 [Polychaeton citri CBS 116435]
MLRRPRHAPPGRFTAAAHDEGVGTGSDWIGQVWSGQACVRSQKLDVQRRLRYACFALRQRFYWPQALMRNLCPSIAISLFGRQYSFTILALSLSLLPLRLPRRPSLALVHQCSPPARPLRSTSGQCEVDLLGPGVVKSGCLIEPIEFLR